jgi:hypothetical protein
MIPGACAESMAAAQEGAFTMVADLVACAKDAA